MACADPIGQLEENLQCTVCLEVLKDPRTLPCCHSFCKDCLEDVVKTCRNTAPHGQPIREIPCPNCRATFPLDPDKHVADMPRNHFICNLVKVTAVLDRGIGVPCSHNCNQSYSVARCVNCEKFLCRECLTDHNKYRGNNGHSVLTMEELSKPENRKKIKDKMYCNEHSGKKLKVYCETCDQLICKDCMDFKHIKPGHSCSLVKDVANSYKELLASNSKTMEGALTDGHVFVQQLSLTTKQLDRDAENIKNQIVEKKVAMLKTVAEMLEQKTKTLLNKVDEIHKDKRANLDRQTEETNQFVENIKTSVQLSKKLVDQGTEEEIISSQKMMLDNAISLLTKREEYFKASIPVAKFYFTGKEAVNEEILRGLTDTFGEVNKGNEDLCRIGRSPKTEGTKLNLEQWELPTRPIVIDASGLDIKKTVKVCGVWQLLLDQIEKEFLRKENSTGYEDDIKNLSVCPNGEDYILVEFVNDISDPSPVGKILKIHGTELEVKQWELSTDSTKDLKFENGGSKSHSKNAREQNVNHRRFGLSPDKEITPVEMFTETKVKLNDDVVKKIEQSPNLKKILLDLHVKLERGKLKGRWNNVFTAGSELLPHISGFDYISFQESEECSICCGDITDKKTLDKCGHSFCAGCINEAFKHTNKKCPVCSTVYGNQPPGHMYDSFQSTSLPGFPSCGTIVISYKFLSGIQGPDHPNPGKPYTGKEQRAYLPNNKEGRKVLQLLKKAFNQKLMFTIGRSVTTGMDNCVTWNDIHLKTSKAGGPTYFGYPDPTYLKRVKEELAAKGITE